MIARIFPVIIAAVGVVVAGAASTPRAGADEEKILNVYNWSDYIAEDTVANFTKETGIKVHYDVYDSNEVLEAKLLAGHSGYDVVVPSAAPYLARQASSGVYKKIDKAALKNYDDLDPQILAAAANADPGNQFGVPYMWGTTGFGYNRAQVKKALGDNAPLDSSALVFDPANAQKLGACGIELLDSAQELFPAALAYLHADPLSRTQADLDRAAGVIQAIRPAIRKFHSSEYINDLANGDICVAWGYSSDINLAKRRAAEANKGVTVVYSIPKEGSERYIDTMAMPKDAPHPQAALAFLNYIMQPEVMAETSNTIYGQSGNADAIKFVKPEIAADKT
ncbi:MAG TPA: extracellular solute-binding protein, partial [Stellaceae bacterium]|nr:extracellular solute-binding protein [Stellaceae bacterium]